MTHTFSVLHARFPSQGCRMLAHGQLADPLALICREPHVEAAVVYAVRPASLLVFVPKFHLKGTVHLTDRAGLVRLPVTAPGQDTDDAFSVSQRRQYRLESGVLQTLAVHHASTLYLAHARRSVHKVTSEACSDRS